MQRFRISGGKLGNHCKECPKTTQLLQRCGNENSFACRIRSLNGFPCPFPIFVAAKKNGPPAVAVAATTYAADSILRCREEKWPACYDRCGSDLPRLILIFVAAKKNGSPATTVAAAIYRVRFYSSLLRRRMARLQNGLATASILDFRPRLGNHCMVCPEMSSSVQ